MDVERQHRKRSPTTMKAADTAAMMGSSVEATEGAGTMIPPLAAYFAVRFATTSLTMDAAENAFGQPA